MSDTIISVENLGKKYVLSHQGGERGYARFSERLEEWVKRPFGFLAGDRRKKIADRESSTPLSPNSHLLSPSSEEEFWALKDVSFEVKRGEVVGIIGRNGAGKSTLLKILSRITEPTEGRVTLRGRVASLLEVGTGFHPELTGRENIFLNGAILGMTKAEIRKKFDEIVAFAEVERFLDTPVKRYSSGMYVRLAFAVAAHLEPEILVVDEVLAVGDAQFQKKCLGKMKSFSSKEGRTVLFVSHNIPALQTICMRGLMLRAGQLVEDKAIEPVIRRYLDSQNSTGEVGKSWSYRNKGKKVSVESLELVQKGGASNSIMSGDLCTFRLRYRVLDSTMVKKPLSVSMILFQDDRKTVNFSTHYAEKNLGPMGSHGFIECEVGRWPFRSSQFRVEVYTHVEQEVQDWIENCMIFESHDGDFYQTGITKDLGAGTLLLNHSWRAFPCP